MAPTPPRMAPMVIRVADIPETGLVVDSTDEFGSLYPDEGWHLDRVNLTITTHGAEVRVEGAFEATARLACSRCLEPLTVGINPPVNVQLLPAPRDRRPEVELAADDLETDFYVGETLDLGALLRSETDLALPMKPLCGVECRGLCPGCGANRNTSPCRCVPRGPDPRFAALEALRRQS